MESTSKDIDMLSNYSFDRSECQSIADSDAGQLKFIGAFELESLVSMSLFGSRSSSMYGSICDDEEFKKHENNFQRELKEQIHGANFIKEIHEKLIEYLVKKNEIEISKLLSAHQDEINFNQVFRSAVDPRVPMTLLIYVIITFDNSKASSNILRMLLSQNSDPNFGFCD